MNRERRRASTSWVPTVGKPRHDQRWPYHPGQASRIEKDGEREGDSMDVRLCPWRASPGRGRPQRADAAPACPSAHRQLRRASRARSGADQTCMRKESKVAGGVVVRRTNSSQAKSKPVSSTPGRASGVTLSGSTPLPSGSPIEQRARLRSSEGRPVSFCDVAGFVSTSDEDAIIYVRSWSSPLARMSP